MYSWESFGLPPQPTRSQRLGRSYAPSGTQLHPGRKWPPGEPSAPRRARSGDETNRALQPLALGSRNDRAMQMRADIASQSARTARREPLLAIDVAAVELEASAPTKNESPGHRRRGPRSGRTQPVRMSYRGACRSLTFCPRPRPSLSPATGRQPFVAGALCERPRVPHASSRLASSTLARRPREQCCRDGLQACPEHHALRETFQTSFPRRIESGRYAAGPPPTDRRAVQFLRRRGWPCPQVGREDRASPRTRPASVPPRLGRSRRRRRYGGESPPPAADPQAAPVSRLAQGWARGNPRRQSWQPRQPLADPREAPDKPSEGRQPAHVRAHRPTRQGQAHPGPSTTSAPRIESRSAPG